MPFELYVHLGNNSIAETIGLGDYFEGENANFIAMIVTKKVLSLEERDHSDPGIFDSTDGPSFPIMFFRPCLQILGKPSSSLYAILD